MHIHELVELGRFMRDVIQTKSLVQQYQALVASVNRAAQNQDSAAVEECLTKLRKTHELADAQILNAAQRKLLSDYGADGLLGAQAMLRVEKAFAKNKASPKGLASAIQAFQEETSQLAKRAAQLITVVEPLLDSEPSASVESDEGRLWLYFDSSTSVDTIDQLEQAAQTWKDILHHFSRLPDCETHEARILHISKHSPLELELAATAALLTPLAFGVKWILSRVEQVIKILQEVEKLKQLKVQTKTVEAVQADADAKRKQIAKDGADALKEEFSADNETRNCIKAALAKILDFIQEGGQLDIDVPQAEQDEAEPGAQVRRDELKQLISESPRKSRRQF